MKKAIISGLMLTTFYGTFLIAMEAPPLASAAPQEESCITEEDKQAMQKRQALKTFFAIDPDVARQSLEAMEDMIECKEPMTAYVFQQASFEPLAVRDRKNNAKYLENDEYVDEFAEETYYYSYDSIEKDFGPWILPWHRAAQKNDLEKLVKVLRYGGQEFRDEKGDTPLHYAAAAGHLNAVRYLVESGSDVNAFNMKGETPLMKSALPEIDEYLKQQGCCKCYFVRRCPVIEKMKHLMRRAGGPLHWAVAHNNKNLVLNLFERGIAIDSKDYAGDTPLYWAALLGHVEMAKLLLERDAAVQPPNEYGITPLLIALMEGQREMVALLESAGARYDGDEPLFHFLVLKAKGETIRWYLERRMSIEEIDGDGLTPLHAAIKKNNIGAVAALLECGANKEATTQDKNRPLHLAVAKSNTKAVALLLKHKVDINAHGAYGITALHSAVHNDNEELVRMLLQSGASTEVRNADGLTPLHTAAERNHTKCGQLLHQHGALIDSTDDDGQTPLHRAASSLCQSDMFSFLVSHGAEKEKTTPRGYTPLHLAAGNNHGAAVKELIESGANIEAEATNKYRPLHIAIITGHRGVVRQLLLAHADREAVEFEGLNALALAEKHKRIDIIELLNAKEIAPEEPRKQPDCSVQ